MSEKNFFFIGKQVLIFFRNSVAGVFTSEEDKSFHNWRRVKEKALSSLARKLRETSALEFGLFNVQNAYSEPVCPLGMALINFCV